MEHLMTKRTFTPLIFLLIIMAASLSGCYYDNEEELYKYTQSPCDTNAFTYAKDIEPIISSSCYSCHGQGSSTGIVLEGYTALSGYVNSNKDRFLGSINHIGGYSAMPQNGNKLSDCNLTKIEKWIAAGAQNN
jgi:hypothetical protein